MEEKTICFIKGSQEQRVDIDFVKKELSQYLQIENLNFLIGSGCSSYIENEQEHAIPTMYSLYENFFSENSYFSIGGINAEQTFEHNLERMLDFMMATKMVDAHIPIEIEISEKIQKVKEFIRNSIIAGLGNNDVLALYKSFYLKTIKKTRKAPINVFTTNYDLYNEKALDELGFFYNNGFTGTYNRKFNPLCYNYAYVENMNLNKDIWQRISNFYNLYKIHGSITWVNIDGQIYEKDYNHIKPEDSILIYPIPLKDRTTLMTPYSDLFRSMQGALMNNNSLLITLGYSFADDHINRLILNALAVPTFRLVVFGEGENIEKLKKIGDNRITIINSEDKIHYFNRFVIDLMPDIQDEVQEKFEMIDGNEAIKIFENNVISNE
ncbi:SIR2 family protein [Acetobacterium paludosum]|uniref:SIR2 family protein n=1 Tax=Acetobacterium paludosum TaxID=52693 RepID=UPI00197A91EB|nr:SIR2 family protein [Acetobacterium paludosum]